MKVAKKNREYFKTEKGTIIHGDSLTYTNFLESESVDLIMTSPPFGLIRKKEYGNVPADEYLNWFKPYAKEFHRILKNTGSLVIDIGGSWNPGLPTRSLYHFKFIIMLCEEFGFHLAQDFYWWNPSKLPTPAEWVTVRRIRVKDAINVVWWLSKSPWPKASNRRVLIPYSPSMIDLLKNGYKAKKRPSGHDISNKFKKNNGAAIPPNLIALPNTESNSHYIKHCQEKKLPIHPARYPVEVPEYFIRMLTDKGDLVLDPFSGSCITGEACEKLDRNWICVEIIEEYVKGAISRFDKSKEIKKTAKKNINSHNNKNYYMIARPDILWNELLTQSLSEDGGRKRAKRK